MSLARLAFSPDRSNHFASSGGNALEEAEKKFAVEDSPMAHRPGSWPSTLLAAVGVEQELGRDTITVSGASVCIGRRNVRVPDLR